MTLPSVLVTGANGQLGRAVRRALEGSARVIATSHTTLDVCNADALRRSVRTLRPTVIINCAAWTAVDAAEEHPDEAWAVNAIAPGILAREAAQVDAVLVHYSTDYVFDGLAARPYTEDAPARPLGVYGASKLAGEEAVLSAGGCALVLRTSWLFAPNGHGFVQTMLRLASESSARRELVRVVDDRRGTPTSAAYLAEATARILASTRVRDDGADGDVWGTYHVAAAGDTTWHGFAAAIFGGLTARGRSAPQLVEIPSSQYVTRAVRPAYSVLDTSKARRVFGVVPTAWESQLAEVLDELFGGLREPDAEPQLAHRD